MNAPAWGTSAEIGEGIYLVGGPQVTCGEDATSFVLVFGSELVMIDAGAGRSVPDILDNVRAAGLDPAAISTLILTHCHIDHCGGAPLLRERLGCRILIHAQDAEALAAGDPVRTAATWYDREFPPTKPDRILQETEEILSFAGETLHCLHTPGHTPGSISPWIDRNGRRILFGQDVHGPFLREFASDIGQWRHSMETLLSLRADVLCEGHFGIFQPRDKVAEYIDRQMRQRR